MWGSFYPTHFVRKHSIEVAFDKVNITSRNYVIPRGNNYLIFSHWWLLNSLHATSIGCLSLCAVYTSQNWATPLPCAQTAWTQRYTQNSLANPHGSHSSPACSRSASPASASTGWSGTDCEERASPEQLSRFPDNPRTRYQPSEARSCPQQGGLRSSRERADPGTGPGSGSSRGAQLCPAVPSCAQRCGAGGAAPRRARRGGGGAVLLLRSGAAAPASSPSSSSPSSPSFPFPSPGRDPALPPPGGREGGGRCPRWRRAPKRLRSALPPPAAAADKSRCRGQRGTRCCCAAGRRRSSAPSPRPRPPAGAGAQVRARGWGREEERGSQRAVGVCGCLARGPAARGSPATRIRMLPYGFPVNREVFLGELWGGVPEGSWGAVELWYRGRLGEGASGRRTPPSASLRSR